MAFEVWEPDSNIEQDSPWIRLSKNTIVISKSLKEPLGDKIQLAYDKKTKTIRIKSVESDEPGIILLKTKIIAKNFFKHFNIEQAGKFEAIYDDKEEAYLIKIG